MDPTLNTSYVVMGKKFNILTRKELSKKLRMDPYYLLTLDMVKNFNVPLRGFFDHEGPIPCGTIVGVVIQSPESESVPYKITTEPKLKEGVTFGPLDTENTIACEQKVFRYKPIYEYFFKIIKIHDNTSYSIKPVFIDGTKGALKKADSHDCESFAMARTSHIASKDFVIRQYVTESKLSGIDLEDCLSLFCLEKFLELLDNGNFEDVDAIREKIPYSNYKNILDPFEGARKASDKVLDSDAPLYNFYESIKLNMAVLSTILTEDEIEKLGTWDLVVSNSEKLYEDACIFFGEYIRIPTDYSATIDACYTTSSTLDVSSLQAISKSLIFRVLLPDANVDQLPAKNITDWSFAPLSTAINGFLRPGNIVRCILRVYKRGNCYKPDTDSWTKLYFKILYKINAQKFLASHVNAYSYFEEDFVFVLDAASVCEIPLTWEGNENLELAAASLTPPPQLSDSDEEDVSTLSGQMEMHMKNIRNPETLFSNSPIHVSYQDLIERMQE